MRNLISNIKAIIKRNRFLFKYYLVLSKIKRKVIVRLDNYRFRRYLNVYKNGEIIFKILDMGEITRMRADLFESKEPETLNWIDSFSKDDSFIDIGANLGVYSLYAALKNHNVISIEPDALNYALLNINIIENNLSNLIIAYNLSIHESSIFSSFNISSYEWGGALNSFDNNKDYRGEEFKPVHYQGSYGIPLDEFLDKTDFCPNHIKIDVDGNEYLILKGAFNTLRSKSLLSVLVELDESRDDYLDSIELIKSAGLNLTEKTHAEMFDKGEYATTYNHIFRR